MLSQWQHAVNRRCSLQHTPAGAKFTNLILETFRLNGALIAIGNHLVGDLGLTSARWQVLSVLARGPVPVAEIARQRGLTRQSVQRNTDRLVLEGFVATAPNPAHRRAKLYALTPHGETVLTEITQRQVAWANQVAEGLGTGQLADAVAVLKTLCQRLEKDLRAHEAADRE